MTVASCVGDVVVVCFYTLGREYAPKGKLQELIVLGLR